MRLGIDVESGEASCEELVRGSIKSSSHLPDVSFFLIGNSSKIKQSFPEIDKHSNIFLINANSVIGMDESPLRAVKTKKDSTVVVGATLLKNNTIDVFFSPGNTGATVASSVLTLGRIHGIKKPALGIFFPRIGKGETLVLDIGANPDCNEESLFHNAVLGQAFYKLFNAIDKPRLGLLNMGTEQGKGRVNLKKAFSYLSPLDGFIGNVESYNVFNGSVDVVVCDGFTGNAILKTTEACKDLFVNTARKIMAEKAKKSLLSSLFTLKNTVKWYKEKFTEKFIPQYYGGAPLLGVNGLVIVGHGACSDRDLENAVLLAKKLFESNMLNRIKDEIKKNI